MKELLVIIGALLSISAGAQTKYVTLKVESSFAPPGFVTNTFEITSSETAEVVGTYLNGTWLEVEKEGTLFLFTDAVLNNYVNRQVIIAGPAVFRLRTITTNQKSFSTLRIIPESFSPDKTIIIPEGTAGATITLECSTNLLNWSTATNGFYTGTNSSKFFRIRAERAP
jgi:hypothetical protein